VTGELPRFRELEDSLAKHGQQYPIHRSKFGVIDGYKRCMALVGEPGVVYIDHPEVQTVEEHLELMGSLQPVRMSSKDRGEYLLIRAKELAKLGIQPEKLVSVLAKLVHLTPRQVRFYLPDEFKDARKRHEEVTSSSRLLPTNFKDDFGFLTPEMNALAENLFKSKGKKFLEFCYSLKRHFEARRVTTDLGPIEKEKVLQESFERILTDESLFQELLGRYEEKTGHQVRID